MADVVTTAYTIIFISILLLVGVLVFATVADPVSDQFHSNELVIAAEITHCTGTVDNIPIENVTRAAPVVQNCTADRATCQAMTAGTHYNYTKSIGRIYVTDDDYNGTIYVSYWEDEWRDTVDLAQQSITGTVYGGFDLATIMVIVMAAVGIVSTIFLFGRRGA